MERLCVGVLCALVAGCSSLLPQSRETSGEPSASWQSYRDVQATFDRIIPGKTTADELRQMQLDPATNPSVTVLQLFEVRQRFQVNSTVTAADLDDGVRECLAAPDCRALEVNKVATQKRRTGNAALDVIKVYRETHVSGWRFSGLVLVKGGMVVYKLTGGQPRIHEITADTDVLSPLQAISNRLNLANGGKAPSPPPAQPAPSGGAGESSALSAIRIVR